MPKVIYTCDSAGLSQSQSQNHNWLQLACGRCGGGAFVSCISKQCTSPILEVGPLDLRYVESTLEALTVQRSKAWLWAQVRHGATKRKHGENVRKQTCKDVAIQQTTDSQTFRCMSISAALPFASFRHYGGPSARGWPGYWGHLGVAQGRAQNFLNLWEDQRLFHDFFVVSPHGCFENRWVIGLIPWIMKLAL